MENTKQNETLDKAAEISPDGYLRSRDAFLRDLPDLLAIPKYDRWSVAYAGDERIGIAKSHLDLLHECHKRGLKEDDFFIGTITPYGGEDEEVETGFYEFEDVDDDDDSTNTIP